MINIKVNDSVLTIKGKDINYGHNINKAIEVDGMIVVHLFDTIDVFCK